LGLRLKPTERFAFGILAAAIFLGFHLQSQALLPSLGQHPQKRDAESVPPKRRWV
jgi:hypothetical protein